MAVPSTDEGQRVKNEEALLANLRNRGTNVKLEGSINVNTLITAGTLLVSGALAYATLDKRVAILEQLNMEKAARVEEQIRDMRKDIKELSAAINRKEGKH